MAEMLIVCGFVLLVFLTIIGTLIVLPPCFYALVKVCRWLGLVPKYEAAMNWLQHWFERWELL